MSIAEIERFAADLQSNAALRAESEKAEAGMAPETPLANAIVFAATKGYAFTADDMKEYVKARAHAAGRELTDAELGGIVGGTDMSAMMAEAEAAAEGLERAATVSLTMGITSGLVALGSSGVGSGSWGGGSGAGSFVKKGV